MMLRCTFCVSQLSVQRNIRNKPLECKQKGFRITYGEAQNRPFVTFGGSAGKIKEDKKKLYGRICLLGGPIFCLSKRIFLLVKFFLSGL